jgi:tryptophan synthase beta chain
MPALESAHAVAYGFRLASRMRKSESVVINVSGRGDKDIAIVAERKGLDRVTH